MQPGFCIFREQLFHPIANVRMMRYTELIRRQRNIESFMPVMRRYALL